MALTVKLNAPVTIAVSAATGNPEPPHVAAAFQLPVAANVYVAIN